MQCKFYEPSSSLCIFILTCICGADAAAGAGKPGEAGDLRPASTAAPAPASRARCRGRVVRAIGSSLLVLLLDGPMFVDAVKQEFVSIIQAQIFTQKRSLLQNDIQTIFFLPPKKEVLLSSFQFDCIFVTRLFWLPNKKNTTEQDNIYGFTLILPSPFTFLQEN